MLNFFSYGKIVIGDGMFVQFDNREIPVKIIRKKIKNIYFRIDDNLNILVTANSWVSEKEIKRIISEKTKEIRKMLDLKTRELDQEAYFCFLGNKYNIIYDESIKEVKLLEEDIITKDDKMLDKFYLKKCLEIFSSRLKDKEILFNNLPNYKLKIRKMKTRWGVCNRGNNTITLNTELLKKDITLIDYVIIHELCHFYEPNHSPKFWDLVQKYYPYYKQARKMLKEV